MLKEIHEQPRAITNTIEGNIDHDRGVIDLKELHAQRSLLKGIKRISIVACGTARHAGLIGKNYIERFAKIPVDVDFGSEFRYRDPMLDPGTLLVLISQSGETADTLAALREGKAREIPTLTVCNVRESSLARESDMVLYTNAGPEIGVASTKAFTTQLTLLYMLALELGYLRGALPEDRCRELTADLLQLPILVDKTLQNEREIERIAIEHQGNDFFFYMGRGINYPIALEGALKLKEISYLHAEGYPAGELKHGPIALVDRKAAMLILTPKDRSSRHAGDNWNTLSETVYEKLMSNLQEVKSRGGQIFCIGSENDATFAREARFSVSIPEAPWALNPILLSIPLQFFSYYMALEKGTDVDKPRNLAKSVTVE
jgi:glucosamine--fructose-6-phosphate aminotransferase (isomerizing)